MEADLLFFPLMHRLKEKQSEKLSMILKPRESSGWKREKEGKIPYNLLSESTRWPLTFALWQLVRELREERCQQ